MRTLRLGPVFSLALSLSLVAPTVGSSREARAQDSVAVLQTKRFTAAQKLFDAGSFATALQEFTALAAETKSPNAELYVARCLRGLNRLPEAYEAMARALKDATARAVAEPKYVPTRNSAAADLALLEPQVGKVVVAVADPPPGLEVTVSGAAFPAEKLGVPTAVMPGEVVVRATAPGRAPVEKRATLKGGETTTLTLSLSAAPEAGPMIPGPAIPVAPPSEPPGGLGAGRVAGIAVGVAAVGGWVTFAVAGSMANRRYDAISAACKGHCAAGSEADKIAGGKQLDLVANVGLGVGIAGTVGATLLLVLGGPKKTASSAWIAPTPSGVVAGGVF